MNEEYIANLSYIDSKICQIDLQKRKLEDQLKRDLEEAAKLQEYQLQKQIEYSDANIDRKANQNNFDDLKYMQSRGTRCQSGAPYSSENSTVHRMKKRINQCSEEQSEARAQRHPYDSGYYQQGPHAQIMRDTRCRINMYKSGNAYANMTTQHTRNNSSIIMGQQENNHMISQDITAAKQKFSGMQSPQTSGNIPSYQSSILNTRRPKSTSSVPNQYLKPSQLDPPYEFQKEAQEAPYSRSRSKVGSLANAQVLVSPIQPLSVKKDNYNITFAENSKWSSNQYSKEHSPFSSTKIPSRFTNGTYEDTFNLQYVPEVTTYNDEQQANNSVAQLPLDYNNGDQQSTQPQAKSVAAFSSSTNPYILSGFCQARTVAPGAEPKHLITEPINLHSELSEGDQTRNSSYFMQTALLKSDCGYHIKSRFNDDPASTQEFLNSQHILSDKPTKVHMGYQTENKDNFRHSIQSSNSIHENRIRQYDPQLFHKEEAIPRRLETQASAYRTKRSFNPGSTPLLQSRSRSYDKQMTQLTDNSPKIQDKYTKQAYSRSSLCLRESEQPRSKSYDLSLFDKKDDDFMFGSFQTENRYLNPNNLLMPLQIHEGQQKKEHADNKYIKHYSHYTRKRSPIEDRILQYNSKKDLQLPLHSLQHHHQNGAKHINDMEGNKYIQMQEQIQGQNDDYMNRYKNQHNSSIKKIQPALHEYQHVYPGPFSANDQPSQYVALADSQKFEHRQLSNHAQQTQGEVASTKRCLQSTMKNVTSYGEEILNPLNNDQSEDRQSATFQPIDGIEANHLNSNGALALSGGGSKAGQKLYQVLPKCLPVQVRQAADRPAPMHVQKHKSIAESQRMIQKQRYEAPQRQEYNNELKAQSNQFFHLGEAKLLPQYSSPHLCSKNDETSATIDYEHDQQHNQNMEFEMENQRGRQYNNAERTESANEYLHKNGEGENYQHVQLVDGFTQMTNGNESIEQSYKSIHQSVQGLANEKLIDQCTQMTPASSQFQIITNNQTLEGARSQQHKTQEKPDFGSISATQSKNGQNGQAQKLLVQALQKTLSQTIGQKRNASQEHQKNQNVKQKPQQLNITLNIGQIEIEQHLKTESRVAQLEIIRKSRSQNYRNQASAQNSQNLTNYENSSQYKPPCIQSSEDQRSIYQEDISILGQHSNIQKPYQGPFSDHLERVPTEQSKSIRMNYQYEQNNFAKQYHDQNIKSCDHFQLQQDFYPHRSQMNQNQASQFTSIHSIENQMHRSEGGSIEQRHPADTPYKEQDQNDDSIYGTIVYDNQSEIVRSIEPNNKIKNEIDNYQESFGDKSTQNNFNLSVQQRHELPGPLNSMEERSYAGQPNIHQQMRTLEYLNQDYNHEAFRVSNHPHPLQTLQPVEELKQEPCVASATFNKKKTPYFNSAVKQEPYSQEAARKNIKSDDSMKNHFMSLDELNFDCQMQPPNRFRTIEIASPQKDLQTLEELKTKVDSSTQRMENQQDQFFEKLESQNNSTHIEQKISQFQRLIDESRRIQSTQREPDQMPESSRRNDAPSRDVITSVRRLSSYYSPKSNQRAKPAQADVVEISASQQQHGESYMESIQKVDDAPMASNMSRDYQEQEEQRDRSELQQFESIYKRIMERTDPTLVRRQNITSVELYKQPRHGRYESCDLSRRENIIGTDQCIPLRSGSRSNERKYGRENYHQPPTESSQQDNTNSKFYTLNPYENQSTSETKTMNLATNESQVQMVNHLRQQDPQRSSHTRLNSDYSNFKQRILEIEAIQGSNTSNPFRRNSVTQSKDYQNDYNEYLRRDHKDLDIVPTREYSNRHVQNLKQVIATNKFSKMQDVNVDKDFAPYISAYDKPNPSNEYTRRDADSSLSRKDTDPCDAKRVNSMLPHQIHQTPAKEEPVKRFHQKLSPEDVYSSVVSPAYPTPSGSQTNLTDLNGGDVSYSSRYARKYFDRMEKRKQYEQKMKILTKTKDGQPETQSITIIESSTDLGPKSPKFQAKQEVTQSLRQYRNQKESKQQSPRNENICEGQFARKVVTQLYARSITRSNCGDTTLRGGNSTERSDGNSLQNVTMSSRVEPFTSQCNH